MARAHLQNREDWQRLARQSGYNASQLSKALQVCPRQLHRYTRRLFGRSPQEWLDEERLNLATEMLKQSRSVKWVAFQLGFKQVSHFSREFKLRHRLSPTAFLELIDGILLQGG